MIRRAFRLCLYAGALCTGGMIAWAMFRPAVEGSGVSVTEEREITPDVTEVVLSGTGEVTIRQGPVPSLSVTADDNILPYLTTETSGRKLRLGTRSGLIRPKTKISYTITVPRLEMVSVSGAGEMRVEHFTTDTLTVKLSGAGKVHLAAVTCKSLSLTLSGAGKATASGSAENLTLQLSGAGTLEAVEMKAKTAEVRVSGAGNATVWATDELKATISGAGGIKYKGTPRIEQKVSGAGRVRPLE